MREDEFLAQRHAMVTGQLRDRDITDEALLARMDAVPRHCFVPLDYQPQAYDDRPLPIGNGQTISQPYMVACMTALLALAPSDRVLEIGTGSGYHTAILAGLCREVITIEADRWLHERARSCLHQFRIQNVTCYWGDGSRGFPDGAPYDAIIVAAGSPRVPPQLPEQLSEGGRLVCPVGERRKQTLIHIVKRGSELHPTAHTNCIFVPLVGKDGWQSGTE